MMAKELDLPGSKLLGSAGIVSPPSSACRWPGVRGCTGTLLCRRSQSKRWEKLGLHTDSAVPLGEALQ